MDREVSLSGAGFMGGYDKSSIGKSENEKPGTR